MLLRFGASYVGYGICLLIGSTLLAGICYSMVKYYHKSPNRLRNTTLSDLKPIIIQVIKRSLLMTVVLVALFAGVFGSDYLLYCNHKCTDTGYNTNSCIDCVLLASFYGVTCLCF